MSQIISPEAFSEQRISWAESVWFSDVDDTLIDTAGTSVTASDGIRATLEPVFGSDAATEIQSHFNSLFALMMAGYRISDENDWSTVDGGKDAFETLLVYFESNQKQVIANHGHFKKWSREVFIKRASELAGVNLVPELVQKAADAYWMTLTEQTEVFPDALGISDTIAEHNRPLFLVTSSDARLKMQPDGQFIYDPPYSETLKRQRIELLREKGLRFSAISIGDPEDKPHPDFFNKAIRIAESHLGVSIDTAHAIMLGDSFGGDLQTPKEQLGFGLVVLREKDRKQTQVGARQVTLGDLEEINQFLV